MKLSTINAESQVHATAIDVLCIEDAGKFALLWGADTCGKVLWEKTS